jgi:hypothetical protein
VETGAALHRSKTSQINHLRRNPCALAYGMYMPPFTWRVSPVM